MSVTTCEACGTPFSKATAKFCSKCGMKKAPDHHHHARPPAAAGSTLPGLSESSTITSSAVPSLKRPATGGSIPVVAPLPVPQGKTSSGKLLPTGGRSASPPPLVAVSTPSRGTCHVNPTSGSSQNNNNNSHHTATAEGTAADEEEYATISPTAEEEAQYTAWATLGPEGLVPEMLQTANAADLREWRKGTLIGRGTYGSVYLGLLGDGSFYAVKCVELGNHATDNFDVRELVSLSREINLMQRLAHRNLCSFKGVLYEPDTTSICMFMEYIGGGSLSTIVKRFKPLPNSVVRRWTKQLLSGLLYLHSQHIIHRDVKGDNVLIDTSATPASEAQVKLVDFGAARRLTDAVSQSRTVIGTPYWMAPEVVDMSGENRGYSYKADVWSVGCTVAEMLTGKPPWPNKVNAPAAILMIATSEGMPTELPTAEATPGCLDFMKKCFEREPDMRPTVEDLLQHPWILGQLE